MDKRDEYFFNTEHLTVRHHATNYPPSAYAMHTHNIYEILYFVNGDATHIIEGRKYKLRRGDLIFIRPLKYHFINIDSPKEYERYNFLFDAAAIGVDNISLVPQELEIINLDAYPHLQDLMLRVDYYRKNFNDDEFKRIMPHLLSEMCYLLSLVPRVDRVDNYATVSPVLAQALDYINHNLASIQSIREVADACFVSESYLFRRFKEELLQTPRKYITDKRLLLAQKLIRSGVLPTKVYERCGFGDYTSFYRNYVDYFAHAPVQDKGKGKRKSEE